MRFSCDPRVLRRDHEQLQNSALYKLIDGNPYAEVFIALLVHAERRGYKVKVSRKLFSRVLLSESVVGECSYLDRTIRLSPEVVRWFLSGELTPADVTYLLAHETAHIYTDLDSPCHRATRSFRAKCELVADMAAVFICQSLGVPLDEVAYSWPFAKIAKHRESIEENSGPDSAHNLAAAQRYARAVADEILFPLPQLETETPQVVCWNCLSPQSWKPPVG